MIDENADVFPMVGPGQGYANMITDPFIPSRTGQEAHIQGVGRNTATDMF
jgi:acetolactate synthase-1/2/3 large subunit